MSLSAKLLPSQLLMRVDGFTREDRRQRAFGGCKGGILDLACARPFHEVVHGILRDVAFSLHFLGRTVLAVNLVALARGGHRAALANEGLADVFESNRELIGAVAENQAVGEMERGCEIVHDIADIGADRPAPISEGSFRMHTR